MSNGSNFFPAVSMIFRNWLARFSEARTRHVELQNMTFMNNDKIECIKKNSNGTSVNNAANSISVKKQKKMKAQYKVPFIIYGVALVLIIFGAAVGALWNVLFHKILINKLVLTDSSTSYEMWKKTPVPMYLKIYMFNWTNAGDYDKDSKPKFEEIGPYVFREVDEKLPIKWNGNDTFTFYQRKVWHFEPELSNKLTLDDEVVNLNPVAATVAYSFSGQSEFIKAILSRVLKGFNETLTVRRTVKQLLFEGYDDKLLELALKLKATKLPFAKFGWFYGRNNSETYDGVFNMATGGNNINELGTVREWNYKRRTTFYNNGCNEIEGRIGDIWPPLQNNKSISVFAPDICTALTLKFDNITEHLGLTGYQYIADEKTLDNGSKDPSRKCYCTNNAHNHCQPSGTLNVAKCKFDAPAFVSMPHFYLADESYRKDIDGMNPSKAKHEFQLAIEPKTGIPLKVKAKLQLNLFITPDNGFLIFKKPMYVPMFWFSQEALLTNEIAGQAKFVIILPLLGHVTLFGICGVGVLLVMVASIMVYRTKRNQEDRRDLLKD